VPHASLQLNVRWVPHYECLVSNCSWILSLSLNLTGNRCSRPSYCSINKCLHVEGFRTFQHILQLSSAGIISLGGGRKLLCNCTSGRWLGGDAVIRWTRGAGCYLIATMWLMKRGEEECFGGRWFWKEFAITFSIEQVVAETFLITSFPVHLVSISFH
jgi:hypothetical protein